jgi:hypothetical protein
MHKTMLRPIRKILVWLMAGVLLILLIVPLILYEHSMRLLDEMPDKPKILLAQQETDELWASQEVCEPEECASITPYWIHRWLVVAIINDYITPMELNAVYENVSKMASQIAIHHMREGHFKGRGMLWWHLTHAYLGIWLQRNWSIKEIATKYRLINA